MPNAHKQGNSLFFKENPIRTTPWHQTHDYNNNNHKKEKEKTTAKTTREVIDCRELSK